MNTDVKFESVIQSAERKLSANRVPLKYLFKRAKVNATGSEELLSLYRDYGVIPKSSREDNYNRASEDLSKYQCVSPGDLVVNKMKAWQGSVAISEFSGIVSPAYYVYQPVTDFPRKYFHYLLRSDVYIREFRKLSSGVRPAQWDLDPTAFGRLPLVVPNHETANAIAGFLDRETAEIDAFIADQERLIELLEERRTAALTHAVTKGLDPTVPMRDSGVEWLGKVPKHWKIQKIKWLSQVKRGASPRPIDDPKYFSDDGIWSWVRISDVSASDGRLRETTQKLSPLGSSKSVKLDPGSLFVSIAATVGKPCITEIKTCIHDGFVYFPGLSNVLSLFLYRIFEAGQCYKGLGKLGTQLNLNTDTIGSIHIPVPPEDEIWEILSDIEQEMSVIDAAVGDAQEAIALSRERRAALISAAVTGQMDVSQAQPPVDEMLEEEVRV